MKLQDSLSKIWWPWLALGLGLLVGASAFSSYSAQTVRQLKQKIAQLEEHNKELDQQSKQLRYIHDLAVEFSMDLSLFLWWTTTREGL